MTTEDPIFADLEYTASEAITAWLGTAGSQIFFMQLGFLCYEVGFVRPVWAPSIILKNIEDTFGILTYLAFSHTLISSTPSIYGIISMPNQPFLISIDPSQHEEVFVAAVFATACATIISGAVLERMKNKAYILWCCLIILINYSFCAHWIWNPEGWLAKLGYMDGAGAVVVHSTGGAAGLIAVWRLGPRRGGLNKDGTLKEVESAHRPIINAIGAFVLWYGWFAFNVSSPVAAALGVGPAVGTTALVTCIGPTCASCSALLLMYWDFATLSYDNLLGAMLAGLVGITGCCFTVNIWEAAVIGFFASAVFFLSSYIVRDKLRIDDPLQVIPVHFCCGLYSCIMEGVFANNVAGHPGLVFAGYQHFGVQLLGTFAVFAFNILLCLFLWVIIMERVLFRKTAIRVSILDTYLGVSLFELNNTMALEEILTNKTNLAKQMAWQFHNYTLERFNNEQFDFLIAIQVFQDLMQSERDKSRIAKVIIQIIETYILPDALMCVNLSGTQRARLIKIRNQLQFEVAQLEIKKLRERQENGDDDYSDDMKHKLNVSTTIKLDYSQRIGVNLTNEVAEQIDIPSLIDDQSVMIGNNNNNPNKNIQRTRLSNRRTSSLLNQDLMSEKVFDLAHNEVLKIVLPVFTQFLQKFDKKRDTVKDNVRLPFALKPDWRLEWDEKLERQNRHKGYSLSKAAKRDPIKENHRGSLLTKQINLQSVHRSNNNNYSHSPGLITHSQQLELVNPSILNVSTISNTEDIKTQTKTNNNSQQMYTPQTITEVKSTAFVIDTFDEKSKVEEEEEQNEEKENVVDNNSNDNANDDPNGVPKYETNMSNATVISLKDNDKSVDSKPQKENHQRYTQQTSDGVTIIIDEKM